MTFDPDCKTLRVSCRRVRYTHTRARLLARVNRRRDIYRVGIFSRVDGLKTILFFPLLNAHTPRPSDASREKTRISSAPTDVPRSMSQR